MIAFMRGTQGQEGKDGSLRMTCDQRSRHLCVGDIQEKREGKSNQGQWKEQSFLSISKWKTVYLIERQYGIIIKRWT